MPKPERSEWIRRKLKQQREEYIEMLNRKTEQLTHTHDYDTIAAWRSREDRAMEQQLIRDEARLNELYTLRYERPEVAPLPQVEVPKVRGIERYAKTRTKAGNEMFNLNYLVKEKSPRQFERFIKATHGRTVKKMLLNNIKFAESQGAKNWTTRAKKFIQNFKGSKEELVYQVAERYGNKVGQYSSDFNLKNAGGIVKESERLTKSGKIRQRYRKRAAAPDVKYIDKANRQRLHNVEAAMYRMFKIDNRGKDFDSDGYGIITQYWLNRIKDFSTIPRAGLGDLEEQFFDYIKPLGQVGGQTMYAVQLSERARKVLKRMQTQSKTAANQYGRKFFDLYKVKGKPTD